MTTNKNLLVTVLDASRLMRHRERNLQSGNRCFSS